MNPFRSVFPIVVVASAMFFLVSCKPFVRMSSVNLANNYREDFNAYSKSIFIHSQNDSLLIFNIIANPGTLLYARKDVSQPYQAKLQVTLLAFPSFNADIPTDSASHIIIINADDSLECCQPETMGIKHPGTEFPVFHIQLTDVNRNAKQEFLFEPMKISPYNAHHFVPVSGFHDFASGWYCLANDTLEFTCDAAIDKGVEVLFYRHPFAIPAPPFEFENAKPLSISAIDTFHVDADPSGHFRFVTKETGLYFFSFDPTLQEGLGMICSENGFPEITNHQAMLGPLRYITTQKEYDKLIQAPEKGKAIDEFWLKTGGREEHARHLIRQYYSRVALANRLFSCHTEGWKTDRGMIYIVFGPPSIVYRSSTNESWIYGEENNFFSVTFVFDKMLNRYSNNDYFLQRNPVFKDNWYRAVDIWRQ